MADTIITKPCRDCQTDLPLGAFRKKKGGRLGVTSRCIPCLRIKQREWQGVSLPPPDPDLPGEQWKPIAGFTEIYSVSQYGRVRREAVGSATYPGRILKTHFDAAGYPIAGLTKNGKTKPHTVHRLVCNAFLGPCPANLVVNHKDGNKANNYLTNLEYATYHENNQHAVDTGLQRSGERHEWAKLTAEQVHAIRRLRTASALSCREIGERFGVSGAAIALIVRGRNWKHI